MLCGANLLKDPATGMCGTCGNGKELIGGQCATCDATTQTEVNGICKCKKTTADAKTRYGWSIVASKMRDVSKSKIGECVACGVNERLDKTNGLCVACPSTQELVTTSDVYGTCVECGTDQVLRVDKNGR